MESWSSSITRPGASPSKGKVNAGYALQLGLAGLLVETGGVARKFRARLAAMNIGRWLKAGWQILAIVCRRFPKSPKGRARCGNGFCQLCRRQGSEAIAERILGDAPFIAKLKPDYAVYTDYDQLMRLDEWIGQQAGMRQADGR
jgi:ATP-dependent helicase/nuclease subunit B